MSFFKRTRLPHLEWLGRLECRGDASSHVLRFVALVTTASVLVLGAADHATAQERALDGDPVDLFTGLHTREHDDIVLDGNPEIRLTRSYRNRVPASRAFGIETSHSYDLYLVADSVAFTYVDLILKCGDRIHFLRPAPVPGHERAQCRHPA